MGNIIPEQWVFSTMLFMLYFEQNTTWAAVRVTLDIIIVWENCSHTNKYVGNFPKKEGGLDAHSSKKLH